MILMEREKPVWAGGLALIATALAAIGLVMVASASASLERPLLALGFWRTTAGRQAVFVAVGLIVMAVTGRVAGGVLASPGARRKVCLVTYAVAVVLLVAALVPAFASAHRGSHRWVRFVVAEFPIGFQPSELAKLAMVALVASVLTERDANPRSFRQCFLPASLAIGTCVLLVGKEDFGTCVLLAGVGIVMLFVGGCRLRHLAALGSLGTAALTMLLLAAPYRIARLSAFTGFWDDPRGSGYQPLQSLTTIASGGWLGTGLGSGVQKYGYLPESRTDFIFAVICEELGVFGAFLVIALFGALIWLVLRIMLAAPTRFERLLAFGLGSMIGLQAVMNIAVVTVVTPTTGISLPLISAGGSSVLMTCLAVGILIAIGARASNGVTDAAQRVQLGGRAGDGVRAGRSIAW